MSRLYSYMEDVACRTRTVTAVCSHRARKRHPSSLTHLLWMPVFHRLRQAARVLAMMWTLLLLFLRKVLWCMFGRSQRSLRKIVQHQPVKYHRIPVSPHNERRLIVVKRKTLVLDLDETLIHAQHDGVPDMAIAGRMADFLVKVTIDDCPVQFHIYKRPHVDFFLKMVSQWYDLVVFTASLEVYGTAVVSRLDRRRKMITQCFFRQHCTMDLNGYTKDLTLVSPDLSKVLILDNSPGAYRSNPDNAIPIKSWFSDPHDTALLNLLPVLDALRFTTDVRSVLSRNLHLNCMH